MKSGQTNKFVFVLNNDFNGKVPDWVQLLPCGLVKSTKGNFTVDQESMQLILSWFTERANDVVVDYEHQTLSEPPTEAPAAGWAKELQNRGKDGLWARIEWTDKASEYIANREYRYLSPVVLVRKSDRKAAVIHSIGLTNAPAVSGMPAIVNKDFEEDENMDLLQLIACSLGLPEDATQEQVMAKIDELNTGEPAPAHKEVLSLLDLKEDASLADIKGRVIALKNPSGYVKAEEFNELKTKLDQRDRDELVGNALTQGKISPAQKAWADEYALKDPEGFKSFIEQAPQVVPLDQIVKGLAPNRSQAPDELQLSINKMLGIDEETFKKFGGGE